MFILVMLQQKCILNELILVKKLKVNLFMFWCIYVKVCWTKNLRLNI